MQTSLQLLTTVSKINLHVLRAPKLRSSKAGKQPRKPSLKACGKPNHTVFSSLLVDTVLRPFADRPLKVHLVDVGKASGLDLLLHDVGDVGGIAGVLRGVVNNVAELAEAGSFLEWVRCEGLYWRTHVDVLDPSAWLEVAI